MKLYQGDQPSADTEFQLAFTEYGFVLNVSMVEWTKKLFEAMRKNVKNR